jgi:hypothetical protein
LRPCSSTTARGGGQMVIARIDCRTLHRVVAAFGEGGQRRKQRLGRSAGREDAGRRMTHDVPVVTERVTDTFCSYTASILIGTINI